MNTYHNTRYITILGFRRKTYHDVSISRYITRSSDTTSSNKNNNKANSGGFRLSVPRHGGSKEREGKAS